MPFRGSEPLQLIMVNILGSGALLDAIVQLSRGEDSQLAAAAPGLEVLDQGLGANQIQGPRARLVEPQSCWIQEAQSNRSTSVSTPTVPRPLPSETF